MGRLTNKVAVVTGASRGIGRATALALAREGAHVVALARTQGGLEALDDDIQALGGSATLVPANLTDFAAIDRLGAALYERWGKLDILIGNAGILGGLAPLAHVEPKAWDQTMAINVTANWRLIRSLEVLLRQSDAGRAVFISSGAAQKCTAFWGPYSVSKAALDALVKTWGHECSGTKVRVNLFSPGPVATKMRADAMPGEDPATLPSPDVVAAQIMALCQADMDAQGAMWRFQPGLDAPSEIVT